MAIFADRIAACFDDVPTLERELWERWHTIDGHAHPGGYNDHRPNEFIRIETPNTTYYLGFMALSTLQSPRSMIVRSRVGEFNDNFQYYPFDASSTVAGTAVCESVQRGEAALKAMTTCLGEIIEALASPDTDINVIMSRRST